MGKSKRRGKDRVGNGRGPTARSLRIAVAPVVLLAIGALAVVLGRWPGGDAPARANVSVPARLSSQALAGQRAFDDECAQCHGRNAAGTDRGPPLVHEIYNPGHHSDAAFVLAAQRGVVAHHWNYGDTPPRPQVSREDLSAIVQYVRELQRANGITYKPHRM